MKRRGPEVQESQSPDSAALEKFAQGADGGGMKTNPHAPRNFKAVRLPFNEYEWDRLEVGCQITGRSKLNLLREAMLAFVDATETDQKT